MINKRNIDILRTLLLLILFHMFTIQSSASNETVSITLPMKQIIQVESETINVNDLEFIYRLEATNINSPLPVGNVNNVYDFSMVGNINFDLEEIVFEDKGIYEYYLYQIQMVDEENYVYDTKIYTITVYVKGDGEGGLVAQIIGSNGEGEKVEVFTFENIYTKSDEINGGNEGDSNETGNILDNSTVSGTKPNTGDTSNITSWLLLCLVISGVLTIRLYWIHRDKPFDF